MADGEWLMADGERSVHRPSTLCHQPSAIQPWACLFLLPRRRALRRARLHGDLLQPPVEELRDVDLVLARARNLVDPPELLRLVARFAEHPHDLAVERQLVHAAWECVAAVEELCTRRVRRRDADRHCAPGAIVAAP